MMQEILSPAKLPETDVVPSDLPTSLGGKITYVLATLLGVMRLRWTGLTHAGACRAAERMARALENAVFPVVREHGAFRLTVSVPDGDGDDLTAEGPTGVHVLPGTGDLTTCLRGLSVRRLLLDTRLEDNQIVEALKLLFLAGRHLTSAPPGEKFDQPYRGWDAGKVADALRSPGGVHLRCQSIFLLENGTLQVDYSYCDLFLTALLRRSLHRRRRHGDHRIIFSAAPRVGVVVGLVLLVPLLIADVAPAAARILGVIGAVGAGFGAGVSLYALGSVQYARENFDRLSRDLMNEVVGLSRFPEVNPDLVARIEMDGTVSYLNPAGRSLLSGVGADIDNPEAVLPPGYRDVVATALKTGEPQIREFYLEGLGRTGMYRFSPFPDSKAVIVAATDVSELRRLTDELEDRVQRRTEELRLTRDATVLSLAGLAESRDPETGLHLERTSWYIRILAEHMRAQRERFPRFCEYLTSERIETLVKTAPLHDIGKVGVPDHILLKPGPLTPDEFAQMKLHTRYGADALHRARERLGRTSFLAMGEEIAMYHHERWDGTGYPTGIGGDEIPISARLMAIADVYDALTSKRVYKEAFSHNRAVEIITAERGRQLDPDLVDAFLDVADRFNGIRAEMRDRRV